DKFFPNTEYKEKLFCYEIPHLYDVSVENCPKFKNLLQQWLGPSNIVIPDDIFEMIGYSMTMNTDMKMAFFIYGPSNTGKTQFQRILEHIIGHQNRTNISLQRMCKNEFGTHGLQFKILNMVGDMSSLAINDVGRFKELTGDDTYSHAEIKNGKQYDFRAIVKIWYNGNDIPMLEEDDDAFYNRWTLVEFPIVFPMYDDGTIKKIWKQICEDPIEVKGIICEAISGLKRLMERNYFRFEIIENTKHVWKAKSEPLYAFIHEKCITGPHEKVLCSKFLEQVNSYFYHNSKRRITTPILTNQLEKYGIYKDRPKIDGVREYYYMGVGFKRKGEVDKYAVL
ncbi:unnamed protein product, partial [marine sediment metagenome]